MWSLRVYRGASRRPPGSIELRPAAADRVDRRGEASPLAVAEPGRGGGVELPAHGAAPDHIEPEVGWLLAGEVDHLERVLESVATRVETARDLEPRQHARDPVEAPPRLHRVEVRADHEGRPRACPARRPIWLPAASTAGTRPASAMRSVSHWRAARSSSEKARPRVRTIGAREGLEEESARRSPASRSADG